jgi:tRNA-dihydrouridine synthase 1
MLSRSFMPLDSSKDLLAYTPMLHARLFSDTPKFRHNHFQPLREPLNSHPPSPALSTPPPDIYLDGNPTIDRPLFVQFCANDPDEFLNAAKYVAPFCDAVDLNLGCPQGIARKGKYGAFLQEDQQLIFNLINKLHKELDVPVTAKLRILDTREKTLEYAKNVISAGASIITIHGRTREMKGHKTGLADWKVIKWLREQIPKEVVMFANGNILKREDIDHCLEQTGVDGVMSAEGNLYDPAIFSTPPPVGKEGREYWRGRDGKGGYRMDAVFRRYMDIIYKYVLEVPIPERKPLYLPGDTESEIISEEVVPETTKANEKKRGLESGNDRDVPPKKKQKGEKKEKTQNPNFLAMQPHLFHLLRALVSKHHNVRDALARCRAGDIAAFENVLQMVELVCKEGIKEYEATDGKSWEEELAKDIRISAVPETETVNNGEEEVDERYESSVETVKACKRPWWIVQPYVRPLPKEALAKGALTLGKKDRKKMELEKRKDNMVPKGHVEVEASAGKGEEVEVAKEGLVCG